MFDDKLKAFATERQRQIMEAVETYGSARAASRALNVNDMTIHRSIKAVKDKAAKQGYSPDHDMTRTVPDGFRVKGVSTYYNKEGKPTGQWVKSQVDAERQEALVRAFIESLCESVPPAQPIEAPKFADSDLLCLYPLGDPHFGMQAHAPEVGEDFDLKIAERRTKTAVDYLVDSAPPAKTAILLNLGDFFHADDNSGQTRQSGNKLDVDGRHHRVLKIGAWTMVHLVHRLLEKHEFVEVYNERGNHDDISALTLQLALSMHFVANPRVKIDESPAYFHFREFGANLLGFTHGDGPKEDMLPAIMAHDEAQAWGRTKHRVFHRGHFHHDRVDDKVGCTVETHRTLAASDAWHRKSGYRSKSSMKVITYHKEYGELGRNQFHVDTMMETQDAL